jgi:hypothetical protein
LPNYSQVLLGPFERFFSGQFGFFLEPVEIDFQVVPDLVSGYPSMVIADVVR